MCLITDFYSLMNKICYLTLYIQWQRKIHCKVHAEIKREDLFEAKNSFDLIHNSVEIVMHFLKILQAFLPKGKQNP